MCKIFAYMETFYKRVGVKLIELEKKRSWLLAQTGINPSTWSSWEKFGRMPPADRALAIADCLGLTLEFLITGRQSALDFRKTSPQILEIYQKLADMDEQQLRRVLTMVNTIRLEATER
jgi:transcriptional regulator with XRE-family HTH domain